MNDAVKASLPKFGPSYQYLARVDRIVDGDTFDATVDLGFRISHGIRIRVRNIDTAEVRARTQAERDHAKQAIEAAAKCLPIGSMVTLVTAKAGVYNRWEADVYYIDEAGEQICLSTTLRSLGMEKLASYPEG